MELILGIICVVSILLNIYLISKLQAYAAEIDVLTTDLAETKAKALKPERPKSLELQEFLVDLMSNVGVIGVARLDPAHILLRSPKEK